MIRKIFVLILAALAFSAHAAVDINKASQADLESVQGIGPSMSKKILAERGKGSFKDWNDLVSRVAGVGDSNAAKFSSRGLSVNGAAFQPSAASLEKKPAKAKSGKKSSKGDSSKAASTSVSAAKANAASKSSKASSGAEAVKAKTIAAPKL